MTKVFRLCKTCLDREFAARGVTALPRRTSAVDSFDPMAEWCFVCGAVGPTLPALPLTPRMLHRAA